MHYLYKIIDTQNNKVYIGQTVNAKRRWQAHCSYAKNPEKTGQYIHRAMAKYGIENFIFQVIDFAINQWQADCIENNLIESYDSRNPDKGYNLLLGGNRGNWIGRKHTSESLAKMSLVQSGKFVSKETKTKMSNIMKEKCDNGWVQANRAELSALGVAARKGKPSPRKGMKSSEETIKKITENNGMFGKEPWNKKELSEIQLEEIKKLSSEGYSPHKIMKITKIDSRIVKRYLLLK